ncbi:hypothetical protein OG497_37480 [Streptomyces sp. NBC_01242]|uniref:hypothetical protein n=1 Tax=Streptomyces sp. NBC_01242 TaxID=2903795 RepID=UPI00224CC12A|nr:hypothetical protein [Streptomyces sp. NBC_01242]MCX4799551.1 hypothetical protein [Streptomyces sp. NBC_01242]
MALASIGFSGGPQLTFRINPSSIDWGFDIHSSVTHTVGGRVVQITGATLRDMTVVGYLGENRRAGASPDRLADHAGVSWRLHEAFMARCRAIMDFQSRDASRTGKMHEPATFNYPPKDWRWKVYLKSVEDLDGSASVEHRTGKFSHGYQLTLFIVQSGSASLVSAGESRSEIDAAQAKAISSYIERISEGIGWRQSEYNGGLSDAIGKSDKGQKED